MKSISPIEQSVERVLRGSLNRSQQVSKAFLEYIRSEVAGSVILLLCTILALIWANSQWAETYFHLIETEIGFTWGESHFALTLHEWINDALMAIFFLVVGLEIKRELMVGELSSFKLAILPVSAAVGGMIVPAAIYLVFNAGAEGARGWGVPMSTDIAFALGILALFGRRVPLSLKVFLTALAIADDMGAVLVIALFYTAQIYWGGLLVALIFLGLMFVVSQIRIRRPAVYILLAIVVWLGVLFSGVHATVAGILIALVVPSRSRIDPEKFLEVGYAKLEALQKGPALTKETLITDHERFEATHDLYEAASDLAPVSVRLEHSLHPTTAYFILPLFALFNAGVPLDERIFASLANPVSLGIIFGLVLGKQIGVTLFSWLVVKSGQARLPAGVTWGQLYGVSWLAGVGFTMALFVSELAFIEESLIEHAKVGILAASLIAAVLGYLILNQLLPAEQTLADREADAHSRPQSV